MGGSASAVCIICVVLGRGAASNAGVGDRLRASACAFSDPTRNESSLVARKRQRVKKLLLLLHLNDRPRRHLNICRQAQASLSLDTRPEAPKCLGL